MCGNRVSYQSVAIAALILSLKFVDSELDNVFDVIHSDPRWPQYHTIPTKPTPRKYVLELLALLGSMTETVCHDFMVNTMAYIKTLWFLRDCLRIFFASYF